MLLGKTFGRYEFLTLIDRGGMASVFVARSVGVAGFERLVAVKVLHPHMAHEEEFVSMFLDEARLAARIRHPNVVATLDVSDSEGEGFFMVMEYIEGDHLGTLLKQSAKQKKRLPPPVVSRVLLDALAGLGAAHRLTDEKGQPMALVHRDVSPHNVLVGTDGISRLTDFGIAKADVRLTSTREGQFKGKVTYMAPEQAVDGTATQRSDLFSTGIVLWEALTGTRLFLGENHAATLYKILEDEIPPPSTIEPALAPFDPVVAKALTREPEGRYQTAEEFAEALEKAAGEAGGVAAPRTVAEMVTEYAGTKIEGEAKRVRESIDRLGKARLSLAPRPQPRPSSADSTQTDVSSPVASPDATVADSALVVAQPPPKRSSRAWIVGAMIGALLVVGGVAVALVVRSSPPAEQPAAAAATPKADPPPEPVASAEEAPTPPVASASTADAATVDDLPIEKPAAPDERKAAADRPRPRRKKSDPRKERSTSKKEPSTKEDDLVSNPYRR